MKIKVKDLGANPFRKIEKYPFSRLKIKALKNSIKETSFWDNILARPCPTDKKGYYKVMDGDGGYVGNFDVNGNAIKIIEGGNPVEWIWQGKFEIAYGHHRWAALKELNIKEIDIPIHSLDDATMLRIMANENMDTWGLSPVIINETIIAAKEFMDKELKKYETLSTSNKFIKSIFKNEKTFQESKIKGVDSDIILKFLGGNWKQWVIQEALSTLDLDKEGKVDRHAIETLPTVEQARVFKGAVKTYNIPKPTQKKLAKKIVKEGIGKRDIPKTIRDAVPKYERPVKDRELDRLKGEMEKINSKASSLYATIVNFNLDMKKLDVKRLSGSQSLFTVDSIADLLRAIVELLNFFGFSFKQLLLKGKGR